MNSISASNGRHAASFNRVVRSLGCANTLLLGLLLISLAFTSCFAYSAKVDFSLTDAANGALLMNKFKRPLSMQRTATSSGVTVPLEIKFSISVPKDDLYVQGITNKTNRARSDDDLEFVMYEITLRRTENPLKIRSDHSAMRTLQESELQEDVGFTAANLFSYRSTEAGNVATLTLVEVTYGLNNSATGSAVEDTEILFGGVFYNGDKVVTFDGVVSETGQAITIANDNEIRNFIDETYDVLESDPKLDNKNEYENFDNISVVENSVRQLQAMSIWSNCYPGQDTEQEVKIGLAITNRVKQSFTSALTLYEINKMVNNANIVYTTQLNIRLVIADLYVGYSTRKTAAVECSSLRYALSNFTSWTKPSEQGVWHLIDDCMDYIDSSGEITVGSAYIGSLCNSWFNTGASILHGTQSWLTLAHEIGHNFGAHHSFENGVGTTGGIMDYGNGMVGGRYQFHNLRKTEVCKTITAVTESECSSFDVYVCANRPLAARYFPSNVDQDMPCDGLRARGYCTQSFVQEACPLSCGLCVESIATNLPSVSPTPLTKLGEMGYEKTSIPTEFPTSSKSTMYPSVFPTVSSKGSTDYPTAYPTRFPTNFPI